MGSESRPTQSSGKQAKKRILAQPPGLGLGGTKAPLGQRTTGGHVPEIDRTLHGNLTDDLVRQTGVLEDSMEMDDDGTSRRAYGQDLVGKPPHGAPMLQTPLVVSEETPTASSKPKKKQKRSPGYAAKHNARAAQRQLTMPGSSDLP